MRLTILLMLLVGICFGCSRTPDSTGPAKAADGPDVLVTSQPLLEMASAVSGELLDVRCIVPREVTSRTFRPSKSAVRKLQDAELILISGAGYEPWTSRISLPGSRLRDTAVGYYDQFLRIPDAITHQHGPDGKHAHPGTVWATWLDPLLASSQLNQVTESLVKLRPQHETEFRAASAKLRAQIDALDQQIAELTAATTDAKPTVYSDGPFYQYLTDRFGWTLNYLHWDDDARLSDAERDELSAALASPADTSRDADRPALFLLSTRESEEAAEFISSLGLKVVRIDLCEFPVESSSLGERLQGNLNRLKEAVSETASR
jgi:zinc transport system substrate-binding protein